MYSEPETRALFLPLTRSEVIALLLILVAVLFLQSWFVRVRVDAGESIAHALNLGRLLFLPLLLLGFLPVLYHQLRRILSLFNPADCSWHMLLCGVATGVLMRIAGWAESFLRVASGLQPGGSSGPMDLTLQFSCPTLIILATAIATWLLVVPVVEETVFRGVFLSAFLRRGAGFGIVGSALVFTLTHPPASWLWVFLFGLLFGVQRWRSGSLWLPLVTHATYDAFNPLDKLCLRVVWQPTASELPAVVPMSACLAVLLACAGAIVWLLPPRRTGPATQARSR